VKRGKEAFVAPGSIVDVCYAVRERHSVSSTSRATVTALRQPEVSMDAGPEADRADPDVALLLDSYAAFARGDIAAAVAPLHSDVEWVEPEEFPNGGAHHGAAAAAEYLRTGRAMWAEMTSQATPYRRGEQIVIVHHITGRLHGGSAQEMTAAGVYTVQDGQVVRMHAYADPAQALAL
jgi:ketosteroid isomerase-like protein